MNWYAYVANRPTVGIDPEGLRFWDWYIGGMWGASDWVDRNLLGGQTRRFGRTAGCYDAGQASGLDMYVAGARWGGTMGLTAFTATEAPGVRLALRPKTLGVSGRVYGRFWGYADLHHMPHHRFSALGRGKAHHAQVSVNLFGRTRTLARIPYWPG